MVLFKIFTIIDINDISVIVHIQYLRNPQLFNITWPVDGFAVQLVCFLKRCTYPDMDASGGGGEAG